MSNLKKRFNKEKKKVPITFIALMLIAVGIGFAAIAKTFGFYGNANVAAAGLFDIRFENLTVKDGSVSALDEATIDASDPTKISFGIKLEKVEDFYEFEVDIHNEGTIEGKVSEVILSANPEEFRKYLDYTVMYSDGNEIKVNDILVPGTSQRIKVRIAYAEDLDMSDMTNTEETLELSFNVKYVENIKAPTPPDVDEGKNLIQVLALDKDAISDASINFDTTAMTTDGKGLYLRDGTQDLTNPIYYYRGTVANNNVIFANMCWKIVRTTETAGTKLLYNGPVSETGTCTGSNNNLGLSEFNDVKNNPRYVGYMYNTSLDILSNDPTVNTQSTVIKELLDGWYETNLASYENYFDDAIWCNDRSTLNTSGTYTFTSVSERNLNGTEPKPEIVDSRVCTREIDRFTTTTERGNGALIHPIGLLTADEVVTAGVDSYLSSTASFWTMTPFSSSSRAASGFAYYDDNNGVALDQANIDNADEIYVRPSIVLKSNMTVESGSGTSISPYKIGEYVEEEPAVGSIIQQLGLDTSAKEDTAIDFNTLNESGLYKWNASSAENPVYYYRGNVTDNNVLFANMCWKIVRTTEAGGTKLIYNGTATDNKCSTTGSVSIGETSFNSTTNNPRYVGYMFNDSLAITDDSAEVNTTDSNIKTAVDTWYRNNMTSYTDKLEDAVWCNDRENTLNGSSYSFAANETRDLLGTPAPEIMDSKICSRNIDKFTTDVSNGNGKLEFPVGLLTADEIVVASSKTFKSYLTAYPNTANASMWTMTPASSGSARNVKNFIFYDDDAGNDMADESVGTSSNVRPSIVIKKGVKVTGGSGTADSPYVIE